MPYRLTEHTADLGAEVTADSLGELFAEAARALTAVAVEQGDIAPRTERRIQVSGQDLGELLVSWLNELIFLQETEGLVFSEFEPLITEETVFEALIRGEPLDPDKHGLGREVKAATYHELDVARDPEGRWRARVVFDI